MLPQAQSQFRLDKVNGHPVNYHLVLVEQEKMKQELFLVQVWKCLEIVNYSGLTMILKEK